MKQRASLTLETVMSSPDKVQLLKQAQLLGYRTYLYFIATDDAEITDGRILEIKGRQLPAWFDQAVLQRITSAGTTP
jgi:predicted ABC-type ATPase